MPPDPARPVFLGWCCDAGWLLGAPDYTDTFWNRQCGQRATRQVVIPQVSKDPWSLCDRHAEAHYPG